MSKKRTLLLMPFCLFLIVVSFSSCSKKNELLQHEQTYDEMVAERLRNQPIPIIDPSICKDNPEGYIYFQVGEEIFRYTKDSSIQVAGARSMSQRGLNDQVSSANILEGCEGNPYRNVALSFNFKEGEAIIGSFRLDRFGLSDVASENYDAMSPDQDMLNRDFARYKNSYQLCDSEIDDLVRCLFKNESSAVPANQPFAQYMASNQIDALNRPFILGCGQFVGFRLCKSSYRLYKSVDIYYGFFPQDFNENNIILFDKYIRNLIESMRVTEMVRVQEN